MLEFLKKHLNVNDVSPYTESYSTFIKYLHDNDDLTHCLFINFAYFYAIICTIIVLISAFRVYRYESHFDVFWWAWRAFAFALAFFVFIFFSASFHFFVWSLSCGCFEGSILDWKFFTKTFWVTQVTEPVIQIFLLIILGILLVIDWRRIIDSIAQKLYRSEKLNSKYPFQFGPFTKWDHFVLLLAQLVLMFGFVVLFLLLIEFLKWFLMHYYKYF